MHRTTVVTAATSAGLAAAAALFVAAPAIAENVSRASGEVTRYPHAGATPAPLAIAPEGATARVQSVQRGEGGTVVTLNVSGFEASKQYGAHAHVAPCGTDPRGMSAGGHYQSEPASADKPATHPDIANPANELWLDFATNRAGEGRAQAVVDWQFRPAPGGRSVIIHEKSTSTEPGKHGTAGKRIACLDVPL